MRLSPDGKETVLHNFSGPPDGEYPYAGVIMDSKGNLYGTTSSGSASGNGIVFKVSKTGKESVLYSFAGGTTDGCQPYGGLLRDKAGNLYGTTYGCGSSNAGTVYKLSATGKETVLHNFAGAPSDGANPYLTSLLMDAKGNLYGVAQRGREFERRVGLQAEFDP